MANAAIRWHWEYSTITHGYAVICNGIYPKQQKILCMDCRRRFKNVDCHAPLMTDNGSAMMAAEFKEGLQRLGVMHEKTLPYSPHQNGKQEAFWGHLEGRLMEMLEQRSGLDAGVPESGDPSLDGSGV